MRSAYTNRADLRELYPRLHPCKDKPSAKMIKSPQLKTQRPEFFVRGHGKTHVGCKRFANEDSFWILPQNSLFIVADGMGGHAGGQIASTIATHEMGRHVVEFLHQAETKARDEGVPVDIYTILKSALFNANSQVVRITESYPSLESMGSTLTALLAYQDKAYFAHVGDSRAYLIRDEKIIQVTEDHSYVQELVNFGEISPEEAHTHIRRNLILRSVSRNSAMLDVADVAAVCMREGDRFLICSDGLIEHVRDQDILDTILTNTPAAVPQALIDQANSSEHRSPSGVGTDNTTVVLVEVGKHHTRR